MMTKYIDDIASRKHLVVCLFLGIFTKTVSYSGVGLLFAYLDLQLRLMCLILISGRINRYLIPATQKNPSMLW